eukprot:tig00000552_g2054.t1
MSKVLLGLSRLSCSTPSAWHPAPSSTPPSPRTKAKTGRATQPSSPRKVAVNGLSLGLLSKYVLTLKFFDDDPTGGIMFILGFTHGQTNMLIKATSASFGIKQALRAEGRRDH